MFMRYKVKSFFVQAYDREGDADLISALKIGQK
jgi:hypothetical protein